MIVCMENIYSALTFFQNEISKSRTYVYILLVDNNFSDVESKGKFWKLFNTYLLSVIDYT